jgi:hypothetical protein
VDPDSPSSAVAERLAAERGFIAELSLQEFRGLKLTSLRCAAAASFPIWLQAQSELLPSFAVWLALLAQTFFLALAACYGALESRWAWRASQAGAIPTAVPIHAIWTEWDELRTALWHALALASLVLSAYVGLGRALPASFRSALTAVAATLFLLTVLAETAARSHPARRRVAGGSAAPPLRWIRRADEP